MKKEFFYNEEGADDGSILYKNNEYQVSKKISEIETTSLRQYLNKEVDFSKIDIEGQKR